MANVSMEPTLSAADFFLIDKRAYNETHFPERGDVIVFRSLKYGKKTIHVKRIIGLPGDKIVVRGPEIIINGLPVKRQLLSGNGDEPHIFVEALPGIDRNILVLDDTKEPAQPSIFYVPHGSYFVMGDNRANSVDSRQNPGFVPYEALYGKAMVVYWNQETFKFSCKKVE